MATPPHDRHTSIRGSLAAAIVVVLAATCMITGTPGAAHAAIPDAAKRWSYLMYRSLTADAAAAQLRGTLASQRATVSTRASESTKARKANDAAQTQVTAASTVDATARTRYADARQALSNARKSLTKASAHRPRNNAAVARAKKVVAAAATAANTRASEAQRAADALNAARAQARTTTAELDTANAAWTAASASVRQTQQKIAGLPTASALAGAAAAVNRDVVTQVRARFAMTDTANVYGTTVHRSVAFAFRRMVDDAKADGIALSGGGFRTKQRQIELRKINGCPDVWTSPASSCRVPTAIPGRSLHEIGLAVDVTSGGRSLTAKSPAFKWLVAHADEYGYINLPSEPWHWSITGG